MVEGYFYERKKEVYKVKPLTEGKKNIIATLIEEHDIKTAEDIQEALKDLLRGTIKSIMEAEMDEHIGYEKYQYSDGTNYCNGEKMYVLLLVSFKLKFLKIEILLLNLK
ncbi:MAG: transposase [Fusobacterium periodonticum]|nr:transposase [Fusobacterium periodonticum]